MLYLTPAKPNNIPALARLAEESLRDSPVTLLDLGVDVTSLRNLTSGASQKPESNSERVSSIGATIANWLADGRFRVVIAQDTRIDGGHEILGWVAWQANGFDEGEVDYLNEYDEMPLSVTVDSAGENDQQAGLNNGVHEHDQQERNGVEAEIPSNGINSVSPTSVGGSSSVVAGRDPSLKAPSHCPGADPSHSVGAFSAPQPSFRPYRNQISNTRYYTSSIAPTTGRLLPRTRPDLENQLHDPPSSPAGISSHFKRLVVVVVAPPHRSRRLGTRLVRWGTRGADMYGLESWARCPREGRAVRFLSRCGFSAVGEVTVDDREMALVETAAEVGQFVYMRRLAKGKVGWGGMGE